MKEQPLITVITVTYNLIQAGRESLFRECIESVHNQSYKNIEHLIVDGASNDGTIELIKEFADKGWVKYISEPDSGLYDAMNKGAILAQGNYLAFMNSDDYYRDINGIEKCMKKLVKSDADFSYAKATILGGGKEFKNHLYRKPKLAMAFTNMPFCHQSMIVKKEVFERLGMYNLEYKSASDYDFILKMLLNNCSSVYCDCDLSAFRLGGFSIENANLSHDEIASFYMIHYKKYVELTHEAAKEAYIRKILPLGVIFGVLPYLKTKDKTLFLLSQHRSFRKNILSFRFGTVQKYFKIFGKNILSN